MARYDKYEPKGGGFRAALAADTLQADVGAVRAVSLDANGRVVIGTAGNSGFVGVIVQDSMKKLGDVVDVMTDGEIVEMSGLTAGTKYYAASAGTLNTTTTNPLVGFTAEATRLIVRVRQTVGATV